MSIFRSGDQATGDHAGLYRPANPDGGQRAADPDRLGQVEDRAERHLVQQLPVRSRSGSGGGGKGLFGGGIASDRPTTTRPTSSWRCAKGRSPASARSGAVSRLHARGPGAVAVHRHDAAKRLELRPDAMYPSQALGYVAISYAARRTMSRRQPTLDNHNFADLGAAIRQRLTVSRRLDNHNFEVDSASPPATAADVPTRRIRCRSGAGRLRFSDQCAIWRRLSGGQHRRDVAVRLRRRRVATDLLPRRRAGASARRSPTRRRRRASLQRWLQLTNTAAVWSGGLFRFIPYGDSAVTGNGVHVQSERDADLRSRRRRFHGREAMTIRSGVAHRSLSRPTTSGAWKCAERNNAYNLTPVESRDQNAIELQTGAAAASASRRPSPRTKSATPASR